MKQDQQVKTNAYFFQKVSKGRADTEMEGVSF